MEKYYFKNNISVNDYVYMFLCGVSLNYNQRSKDKRMVLDNYLRSLNEDNKPIILENNFLTRYKETSRRVSYSDAGFSNLYQVEMLVNYLSDINFILLESISTGAEAGMFLGEPKTQKKTCLLIPDEMAIEEDKLGAFLRYSFENSEVNIMRFYPQVKHYNLSENVSGWYTYFNNDCIGENLGNSIERYIDENVKSFLLKFTTAKTDLAEGKIYYRIVDDCLNIEIRPRTLMICVGAILNCEEYEKEFFSKDGHTIKDLESIIVTWLKETFINSIAEISGVEAGKCVIRVDANIEGLSVNRAIGMVLYLFVAARLIKLEKMDDYIDSQKVLFSRKMLTVNGKNNMNFYKKYEQCIDKMVERKIKI